MDHLLEHLNLLKSRLNSIEQIGTKQADAWCSDNPQFDVVLRALNGSRVAQALDSIGERPSWPVPPAGNFCTQMELMLLRDDVAARATLDRILYELYELESSHVWDLETELWP